MLKSSFVFLLSTTINTHRSLFEDTYILHSFRGGCARFARPCLGSQSYPPGHEHLLRTEPLFNPCHSWWKNTTLHEQSNLNWVRPRPSFCNLLRLPRETMRNDIFFDIFWLAKHALGCFCHFCSAGRLQLASSSTQEEVWYHWAGGSHLLLGCLTSMSPWIPKQHMALERCHSVPGVGLYPSVHVMPEPMRVALMRFSNAASQEHFILERSKCPWDLWGQTLYLAALAYLAAWYRSLSWMMEKCHGRQVRSFATSRAMLRNMSQLLAWSRGKWVSLVQTCQLEGWSTFSSRFLCMWAIWLWRLPGTRAGFLSVMLQISLSGSLWASSLSMANTRLSKKARKKIRKGPHTWLAFFCFFLAVVQSPKISRVRLQRASPLRTWLDWPSLWASMFFCCCCKDSALYNSLNSHMQSGLEIRFGDILNHNKSLAVNKPSSHRSNTLCSPKVMYQSTLDLVAYLTRSRQSEKGVLFEKENGTFLGCILQEKSKGEASNCSISERLHKHWTTPAKSKICESAFSPCNWLCFLGLVWSQSPRLEQQREMLHGDLASSVGAAPFCCLILRGFRREARYS